MKFSENIRLSIKKSQNQQNSLTIAMELHRRIRSIANKIGGPSPGKPPPPPPSHSNQGLATLVVMIAVLALILLFCCLAAPGVRDLCRRYIFRGCTLDDPDRNNARARRSHLVASPTIILLPFGRMLVVDRNTFTEDVNGTMGTRTSRVGGMDFMQISANILRSQHRDNSTIFLGSDTTSNKGLSPSSMDGLCPPAYEELFCGLPKPENPEQAPPETNDLPPAYSELSLTNLLPTTTHPQQANSAADAETRSDSVLIRESSI